MPDAAFKVGDRVRCVAWSRYAPQQVGDEFTVTSISPNGQFLRFFGEVDGWAACRFELVDRQVIDPQEWDPVNAVLIDAGAVAHLTAVWCLVELARSGRIIWGHDKPEWVRLTDGAATWPAGSVVKVTGWSDEGHPTIEPGPKWAGGSWWDDGRSGVLLWQNRGKPARWEPADPPEPTVTITVPVVWAEYVAGAVGGFPAEPAVAAACRAALEEVDRD